MTYTLAEVTADPTILDDVDGELRSLRYRAALLDERLGDLRARVADLRADRDAWRAQAQRLAGLGAK
jgi:hypothetical protein